MFLAPLVVKKLGRLKPFANITRILEWWVVEDLATRPTSRMIMWQSMMYGIRLFVVLIRGRLRIMWWVEGQQPEYMGFFAALPLNATLLADECCVA